MAARSARRRRKARGYQTTAAASAGSPASPLRPRGQRVPKAAAAQVEQASPQAVVLRPPETPVLPDLADSGSPWSFTLGLLSVTAGTEGGNPRIIQNQPERDQRHAANGGN
ncbi:hypothetical protein N9Z25_05575 [Luminiphilus sp.]|nr:hypothetical protein [Luminiphilus sp.]